VLEHLKLRHKATPVKTPDSYEAIEKLKDEIFSLDRFLLDESRVEFDFKGHVLTVAGIPEDFRVYLDSRVVCECTYGTIYRFSKEVAAPLIG
jgi:hypothetical protein